MKKKGGNVHCHYKFRKKGERGGRVEEDDRHGMVSDVAHCRLGE